MWKSCSAATDYYATVSHIMSLSCRCMTVAAVNYRLLLTSILFSVVAVQGRIQRLLVRGMNLSTKVSKWIRYYMEVPEFLPGKMLTLLGAHRCILAFWLSKINCLLSLVQMYMGAVFIGFLAVRLSVVVQGCVASACKMFLFWCLFVYKILKVITMIHIHKC